VNPREQRAGVNLRMKMAFAILVPALLAVGVLVKAVWLQQAKGEELRVRVAKQTEEEFQLQSRRGNILDRKGGELAGAVQVHSVGVHPAEVVDKPRSAVLLAQALGLPVADVLATLERPVKHTYLARKIDDPLSARVRELNLPGIVLERESKRTWPQGALAGPIVGCTDIKDRGVFGIEAAMNSVLAGEVRVVKGRRDALRTPIFDQGLQDGDKLEGQSVVLTIDPYLQQVAEEELHAAVKQHQAKRGVAMILDPHQGDILAWALSPAFDPNDPRKKAEQLGNWSVVEDFEPGSVMKVFVLAAALEAGVVSLATPIDCERGAYRIGRHVIHDHAPEGVLSARDVLVVSSNIGASKLGELLGRERLYEAIVAMGLHGKTGTPGLLGEVGGQLDPPASWPQVKLATVSFGQGVTVSRLQLLAAVGAIANGGVLLQPRLVLRVDEPGQGPGPELPVVARRRICRPEVARQVTEAMVGVVHEKHGTGGKARLEGFLTAGKTGTAEKVEQGRYADKWIGTFVGFVPADRPAFVILVSLDEPEPIHYGGAVAGPAAKAIARRALAYRGIFPAEALAEAEAAATLRPQPAAVAEVEEREPVREVSGDAAVVEEPALGLDPLAAAAPEPTAVPSFQGLSMLRSLAVAEEHGLTLEVVGSGRAVHQEPPPGTLVGPESGVRVVFAGVTREVRP